MNAENQPSDTRKYSDIDDQISKNTITNYNGNNTSSGNSPSTIEDSSSTKITGASDESQTDEYAQLKNNKDKTL